MKPSSKQTSAAAGSASSSSTESVASFVRDVKKNKKFKQLVVYAISGLEKMVKPPRIGWELSALEALSLGGADEVSEVLAKHGLDGALFSTCLTILTSLASLPRGVRALIDGPALAALVAGTLAFSDALDFGPRAASPPADEASRLVRACMLLSTVARADAGAFARAGGVALLLRLLRPPCDRAPPVDTPAPAFAAALAAGADLLDCATRSRAGVDALVSDPGGPAAVLALAVCDVIGVDDESGGDASGGGGSSTPGASLRLTSARKMSRLGSMRRRTGPSSPRSPSGGWGGGDSDRLMDGRFSSNSFNAMGNAHLEPTLRALDRVTRADGGLPALLATHSTDTALVPLWSLAVAAGRRTESLALRILLRLLGGDPASLLLRMETGGSGGSHRALAERVLCARLLASVVATDTDAAAALARIVTRPLALLGENSDLVNTDGAEPLLSALASVARSGTDTVCALENAGALHVAARLLCTRAGDAGVAGAAASLLGAMACDGPELCALICAALPGAEGPSKEKVPTALVAAALSLAPESQEIARPAIAFVRSDASFFDAVSRDKINLPHPPSPPVTTTPSTIAVTQKVLDLLEAGEPGSTCASIVSANMLPPLLAALNAPSAAHSLALQAQGMMALNGLLDRRAHASIALSHGALERAIANLSTAGAGAFNAQVRASYQQPRFMSPMGGALSPDGGGDACGGGGAGAGGGGADAALSVVVTASLALIAALCIADGSSAAADAARKKGGASDAAGKKGGAADAAKRGGVVSAMVAAAARIPVGDARVSAAFRDTIAALNFSDAEVCAAVNVVAGAATAMGRDADDVDTLKWVADWDARRGVTSAPPLAGTLCTVAAAASDALSLLEAVTTAPHFSAVVERASGTATLAVFLCVASALRTVDAAHSAQSGGDVLAHADADTVLSRAASVLCNFARFDSEDEKGGGVRSALDDRNFLSAVCRTLLNGARTALPRLARDGALLLNLLAAGGGDGNAARIEAMIALQAVESLSALLRAHVADLDVAAAVAAALSALCVTAKGAAAVALRGASRVILRELRRTAALRTVRSDALVLSYLRVLRASADASPEATECLRRQGAADA